MSIPYSSVPSEYIILNLLYYQNTLHIISQRESKKKKNISKHFSPPIKFIFRVRKFQEKFTYTRKNHIHIP